MNQFFIAIVIILSVSGVVFFFNRKDTPKEERHFYGDRDSTEFEPSRYRQFHH